MKYLFDADKAHFKVWLTLYDIDTEPGIGATFQYLHRTSKYSDAVGHPPWLVALCMLFGNENVASF
jgi:hypothetical protein